MADDSSKARVLIIGATGFIGSFVAKASVEAGHPTVALVRPTTLSNPSKAHLLSKLSSSGAKIIPGGIDDAESLKNAVKEADVVVSVLAGDQIMEQLKIIDAIKEVGTVKRFLPSEFGHDVDRAEPIEPGLRFYKEKRAIRRATESARIGYTYICCNSIAGWPYHNHTQPSLLKPPTEKIEIYGDGNVKAYFVAGEDIGRYTVRAIGDPSTLNKKLHFRPPANWVSMSELADIWERHLGKKLPRLRITEEQLVQLAQEDVLPASIVAALTHDIFFKGCQNFEMESMDDAEACTLYPDIAYSTLDDYFKSVLPLLQPSLS